MELPALVSKPQVTPLFTNEVLGRVERMRLNPNRRRTNRTRGEHTSGKGGSSIEFSDYRDYVAGDDIRYVDWNIFARLQRPYLKLFSHEEELHIAVLLDCSTSMKFEGKFERARQLAAAFGLMGLMGGERVSVFAVGAAQGSPAMVPRLSGRAARHRLLPFLESIEPGGDSGIEQSIDTMLRFHRGRGVVVLLSDFLTFGDCSRAFNMLHGSGLEMYGVQLLGPSEISPELTGDVRFVDSESGLMLDVSSAKELVALYLSYRQALEERLAAECRKRNGRFTTLNATQSIESILFETLLRKGWVR